MEEKKQDQQAANPADSGSLESEQTVVETPDASASSLSNDGVVDASNPDDKGEPAKKPKSRGLVNWITTHLNIYFLMFMLLLVIAGVAVGISYQNSKKNQPTDATKTQNLSDQDVKAIQSSSTKVGDPKQTLNVESNAVFNGKVLIRDSLDVAGTIKVGGPLTLPGITVSGTSAFDEVRINKLFISGDTTVQGQLNVQKTIVVSGGANFGGTISAPALNIDTLTINKDLAINRHISPGGVTPQMTFGNALGSGGTASLNGSDTAGTLTVNTGGSPGAGCFATVTFNQKFNTTPHVVVTPVGSAAASLNYYINRSTSSLSICTANGAPASSTFSFDYVALD